MVNTEDRAALGRLYAGCSVYHGELHDHSDSGGTSDGKCPLALWPEKMRALKMDFAAILDHRQVRHMYEDVWRDGLFIPGTEPGTVILDSAAEEKSMHYNMLFGEREALSQLLAEFPEYQFTGGVEGHFIYPSFTRARFGELIDAVKAHGGFFVHPHPKQLMRSEDPLDYWFRDETGLEVIYFGLDREETRENYALWTALLARGKRIWATAGCDLHREPHDTALTTIYAEAYAARAYLSHLTVGDFTAGPVGVRMCVGGTKMGGQCAFAGRRLVVCAADFHDSVRDPSHEYRLDLLSDGGVAASVPADPEGETWLALDADPAWAFCRAEVTDVTRGLRIALGNPIWNRA